MSQYVDNPGMAVRASAAIGQYRLVTPAGAHCGADTTTNIIGVSMESRDSGKLIPVRFLSAGTIPATAAEAIAVGDLVYKAADGKVGKTNTNLLVGIALSAASADGDFLQVKPV
jgi:hypothetical protein